jgi:hypothetical protein
MRQLRVTAISLICMTALSACGGPARRAELEKKPDETILATLREGGDERVCEAAVTHKTWYGPRTQEVARREAALRQLGDCSEEHEKCVSFGFPIGTPGYAECRIRMEGIKVQAAAAKAASSNTDFADFANTQMLLQSLQPKPAPSIHCTTSRMNSYINTDCH